MTIATILLGLALLIGALAFITRPIWMPESIPPQTQLTQRQALEAQKAVLLDEIRALDFDVETGKLPQSVYESERAKRLAQAAEILKQLDQLDAKQPDVERKGDVTMPSDKTELPMDEAGDPATTIEAEIEAAIARIRLDRSGPAAQMEVEAVAVAAPAGAGSFCSQCGQQRDADDKFCAYCGHRF